MNGLFAVAVDSLRVIRLSPFYARFSAFQEQKGGPAGATTITAADCLRS
jgi:hypothetical protein